MPQLNGMMKRDMQGFFFVFFFLTTYVLKDLPVNLRGRDVLQGMGAILCSPIIYGSPT
jgi:hypothetical protein